MAADDGFQRFMRAVVAKPASANEPSWKVGQRICLEFFRAYLRGELTFEQLCRRIDGVLAIHELDERDEVMGGLVRLALRGNPPKRKRGNPGQPEFIRDMSVRLVKGPGGPINRTGRHFPGYQLNGRHIPPSYAESAFEWVAKYWKQNGVTGVTPLAVEKWYSSRRRATKKK